MVVLLSSPDTGRANNRRYVSITETHLKTTTRDVSLCIFLSLYDTGVCTWGIVGHGIEILFFFLTLPSAALFFTDGEGGMFADVFANFIY